ncbi:efflux pump [Citrobacter amalonaticus]|nr:efflux pump [Citrobacter amalonaticus]
MAPCYPRFRRCWSNIPVTQITGRIFGYNQSFMYLGNVAGPLMGATVSAMAGFRWVFIATAIIVMINICQLALVLRQRRNIRKRV